MATLDLVLAAAVLVLGGAVLLLALRTRDDGVDRATLEASIGGAISDVGLDSTAGQIERHASEMKALHGDIEKLLSTPQARGGFGEIQLETILADGLPEEMYGIREAVVEGRVPDAYVETTEGVICIDSKFPLEAFERYVEAEDEDAAARHRRDFATAVESQLEKIRADYVRPEAGTTEFAFAFIPSERVYYHLVAEEYDLLRAYAADGVQVVSPLTLTGKLDLVRAGVHARRLTEEAEAVQEQLRRLGRRFEDFEDEWSTFVRHMDNAKKRADGADAEFRRLREEFDRIEGLSGEVTAGDVPAGGAAGEGLGAGEPTGGGTAVDEPASEPE